MITKILMKAMMSAVLVCACAGALAQAAESDAVPVYDSTQIALDRYTVIRRLGVQSWQSAFWIRSYRDAASARQALVNEAARLGADGVINLHCLDQTDRLFRHAGHFCYGNAIRLSNERRVTK